MNGVILYQSKYGATKRYADWLSEETGFQCIETRKADINEIVTYDTIILGGGLYASAELPPQVPSFFVPEDRGLQS